MLSEVKEYKVISLVCMTLMVAVIVFLIIERRKYVSVIDEQDSLIEKQICDSKGIVDKWKSSFNGLQRKYADSLNKISDLENELDNLDSVQLPLFDYTVEEIEVLCKCVQCEIGEVSAEGQKYVAQVILNRVRSKMFPDSIKEVVYENHNGIPQFSVTTNGMIDKCVVSDFTYRNVYEVLVYGTDMPKDVLYFYAVYVKGNWVNTRKTWKTVAKVNFAY